MIETRKPGVARPLITALHLISFCALLILMAGVAGAAGGKIRVNERGDGRLGGFQIIKSTSYDADGIRRDAGEGDSSSDTAGPPVVEDALMLSSEIESEITGFIVRTVVRQRFQNQTADWVEGLYRFPLPDKAAVDGMTLIVGDRRIVGTVKEKAEAKRVYQAAVKAGKKAALLTEHRPNIFSTRVGNVAPGAIIEVELTLLSYAEQNGLTFSWAMPQAITPRFNFGQPIVDGDGAGTMPSGEALYAHRGAAAGAQSPTRFSVKLNAGTALTSIISESHDITLNNRGVGLYDIALKGGAMPADRDFKLHWTLTPAADVSAILFRESGALVRVGGERVEDDSDYILGLIVPPKAAASSYIPPRDVAFIIDTSGSMGGESIRQARQALLHAIDLLRPQDRFDIIEFNSGFRRLFGKSRAVTPDTLKDARDFVRGLSANGGTNMVSVLDAVLNDSFDPEVQRQILFLTDGAVGYEDVLFRLVEEKLGTARLFTVGIGAAPNGWFMRKAAEFGRGSHTQISSIDTAGEKLAALYSAMAVPSARGLTLTGANESLLESFPKTLPDLFGETPTVFVARVEDASAPLTLSGQDGQGLAWQKNIDTRSLPEGVGISKMWARKKVEAIMDARVRGLAPADTRAQILEVALPHQILSPYTSFVAVEEKIVRSDAEALKRAAVKGNLPKGTQPQRFFGPKTALPITLKTITGLFALALALMGAYRLWRPVARRPRFATGRLP